MSELLAVAPAPITARLPGDPRPDRAVDSRWWDRLLRLADAADGERGDGLFGGLHALRCSGGELTQRGPALRLGVTSSPTVGELSGAEYEAFRERWLMPHRQVLVELLNRVSRELGTK